MSANKVRTRSESETISIQMMEKLLEKHLKPINDKVDSLCTSVKRIEARIDTMEKEQSDQAAALTYLGEEMAELKIRVSEVENQPHDISPIQAEVQKMKMFADNIEHAKRSKCVEVQGVPYAKGESLLEAYRLMTKKLLIDASDQRLDTVYRIKTTNRIVFRFIQTHFRDQFLSTFRRGSVTLRDLGFSNDDRLYINEVLSPDQHSLFFKARQFRKQNNFKYIWTHNQRIFIKKTAEADSIEIKSENTLRSLQTN